MVFQTTVEITPSPQEWRQIVENSINAAFDAGAIVGVNQARAGTPIGVDGQLKNSWNNTSARFVDNEYQSAIGNSAPYAVFGIMGRKPGKFPPYQPNTPLAAWANKRGITPYLVARKIALEGTERWKAQSNWVGYFGKRAKDMADEKEITVRRLEAGKPIRNAYDIILASLRNITIN